MDEWLLKKRTNPIFANKTYADTIDNQLQPYFFNSVPEGDKSKNQRISRGIKINKYITFILEK
ncbi:hypothetical protein NX722_18670 [Endozoicomonas gorgoniicola]|uniref:Uncharacterized protein n=1 Tax=Endozoicomonas gorgoniicola TaxID=1234144 RepID=A0ABT3MZ05_9GAMM|nr:hypothetical protein [Endozoicomonas gorgoniicola]MCW7554604.1 hypothetical protein [Endozoicomonas gorgoniicola]